jgi:hypothetical protein
VRERVREGRRQNEGGRERERERGMGGERERERKLVQKNVGKCKTEKLNTSCQDGE